MNGTWGWIVGALALGLVANAGHAQEDHEDPETRQERLGVAERLYGASGRWQRLLDVYARELAAPGIDEPFDREGARVTVRTLVHARISRLPAAGLAAYRRRADPPAAALIARARATHRLAPLEQLLREHFNSTHGDDALRLAATLNMTLGRWHTARRLLSRIAPGLGPAPLRFPDTDIALDPVRARLALCLAHIGDRPVLSALLRDWDTTTYFGEKSRAFRLSMYVTCSRAQAMQRRYPKLAAWEALAELEHLADLPRHFDRMGTGSRASSELRLVHTFAQAGRGELTAAQERLTQLVTSSATPPSTRLGAAASLADRAIERGDSARATELLRLIRDDLALAEWPATTLPAWVARFRPDGNAEPAPGAPENGLAYLDRLVRTERGRTFEGLMVRVRPVPVPRYPLREDTRRSLEGARGRIDTRFGGTDRVFRVTPTAVEARRLSTGEVLWNRVLTTIAPPSPEPAASLTLGLPGVRLDVGHGHVLIGHSAGVVAIDEAGRQAWRHDMQGGAADVRAGRTQVFALSTEGGLHTLDGQTGRALYAHAHRGLSHARLLAHADFVAVHGRFPTRRRKALSVRLGGYDGRSGRRLRTVGLGETLAGAPETAAPGGIYVVASREKIVGFAAASGKTAWRVERRDLRALFQVAPERVLVQSPGRLELFETRTGKALWKASFDAPARFVLAAGASSETLYVLGSLSANRRTSPHRLVIAAHDLRTGRRLWRQVTSSPRGMLTAGVLALEGRACVVWTYSDADRKLRTAVHHDARVRATWTLRLRADRPGGLYDLPRPSAFGEWLFVPTDWGIRVLRGAR